MPNRNRATVLVCALVVALSGVAPAQGLVLCIGEDGHVELETAYDGRCSAPCPANGPDVAGLRIDVPHEPDSCCGPCKDIPLFAHPPGVELTVPGRRLDTLPMAALGVFPQEGLPVSSGAPSEGLVPTVCCDEWGPPPFLRTTVLLI